MLIHVQVLSANLDRLRDLGILPGAERVVAFTPRTAVQPNGEHRSTSGEHYYDRYDHDDSTDHSEQPETSFDGGLQHHAARRDGQRDPHR